MSDTYIVTAKTIDEAIAKANKLYADADHEISYDILEMPKKGFLGIGAKDAMLKVTVNSIRDVDLGSLVSELKSMKIHTDRDGRQDSEKEKRPEQKPAQVKENKPQQKKPENKQNNGKPQNNNQQKSEQKPAQKPAQENKPQQKPEQKNQQKQNQQNQPKAQKAQNPQNQPKAEKAPVKQEAKINEKPAEPKKAEASDKSAEVMPKEHNEAIVSAPVGLFDLPEKEPQKGWGKAEEPAAKPVDAEIEADLNDAAEEEELPQAAEKDNVKVAVSEEEMQYALDFANTLLRNMQIDARAERGVCPEGETFETTEDATVYPRIEIVGDGSGILIGHHGETLDAIQYLVNLSAIRKSRKANGHGDYVKIVVDVENYRSKREETLRALARRMAARAVKSKRNVFLEPMNAYERRIIHSELQNVADVSTHSVGSDKNRKIIITYEGADKQPTNSRRKGQRNRNDAQRSERPAKSAEKNTAEKSERPRPKKPQKMPIEQLPDFLAARSTEPDEFLGIED